MECGQQICADMLALLKDELEEENSVQMDNARRQTVRHIVSDAVSDCESKIFLLPSSSSEIRGKYGRKGGNESGGPEMAHSMILVFDSGLSEGSQQLSPEFCQQSSHPNSSVGSFSKDCWSLRMERTPLSRKNVGNTLVLPLVSFKAKFHIGIDCVHTVLLRA